MSEDDYSRADSSAVQPHVPGKHRGPRFTWNPAFEVTFFQSLCESVRLGLREGMTFKAEAWDRAAQALIDRHNAYANKGHLINKSDNARKKYRMWRGLRESPEFLYNPQNKTITGSEEAWRRHIEKEPLSRSLKGRPFEYEEYYEILFPDVIGTGGAPKRVTSRKRKTIGGTEIDDHNQTEHGGTPGTTVMNLLADATYGSQANNNNSMSGSSQVLPSQHPSRPSTTTMPHNPSPLSSSQQQQARPTATAIPPRTSITTGSALTPPEETPHNNTRQRFLAPGTSTSHPSSTSQPPAKRSRTDYLNVSAPSPQSSADSLSLLAEALRSSKSARPGWSEQALDIFFRDFGEEDMDLQIKIAEKALAADENKAMTFCKMPVVLRKHWVKRLREVHLGHTRT